MTVKALKLLALHPSTNGRERVPGLNDRQGIETSATSGTGKRRRSDAVPVKALKLVVGSVGTRGRRSCRVPGLNDRQGIETDAGFPVDAVSSYDVPGLNDRQGIETDRT